MADPLSILTTAIHVSHRIYDVLKTMSDAPEEIRTLQFQASMIDSFLPNVREMIEHDQRHSPLSDPQQLQILLSQTRGFQDAAESFLNTVAKKTSSDLYTRLKYTIRAADGKELKERFQSLLITLIAVTTSRYANA